MDDEIDERFICCTSKTYASRHLLVHPVTLDCEHSFCSMCFRIANLGEKKTCPVCKQAYDGTPKKDDLLGDEIERRYPGKQKLRSEAVNMLGGNILVSEDGRPLIALKIFLGLIFGSLVCCLVYLLGAIYSGAFFPELTDRPVEIWLPEDVETWMNEAIWAKQYSHIAVEKSIDGKQMLFLDEDILMRLFGITDQVDSNAFVHLIKHLKEVKVDMPKTLWEYMIVFPAQSLVLSHYGLNPRPTVLYVWLFHKEDIFNPFMKSLVTGESYNAYNFQISNATGDVLITPYTWTPDLWQTVTALLIPDYYFLYFLFFVSGQGIFAMGFLWWTAFNQIKGYFRMMRGGDLGHRHVLSYYTAERVKTWIKEFGFVLVSTTVMPRPIICLHLSFRLFILLSGLIIQISYIFVHGCANLCIMLDFNIAF